MAQTPESASQLGLASVDLAVPGSDRRGRVFVPASLMQALDTEELRSNLAQCFVDEDDAERMRLLQKAVNGRTLTVETFPGEAPPVEVHAYVVAPDVSESPIFACVLVSLAVVEHLVSLPPRMVMETATLQVVDDDTSRAAMVAGLEAWVRRVWPGVIVPTIRLHRWPDVAVWSPEVPELSRGLSLPRSSKPMPEPSEGWSRREFVPPRPEPSPP